MHNLKLRGAKNTRDLGFVNSQYRIKPKHLYRSGQLCKISKKSAKKLVNEYNIKTVLDLRIEPEKNKKPNRKIEGINYVWLPVFKNNLFGISYDKKIPRGESIPNLNDTYTMLVTNDECKHNMGIIINYLADYDYNQGALLFHCTQGKDRTGLLSLFILHILGVDLDSIKKDYEYTNVVNYKKSRKYYWLVRILGKKKAFDLSQIFLAKGEYFDTAVKVINEKYGGLDNYIKNELNVSDEARLKLKDKLIEK